MSYLVFARKWRPKDFDEVIGQGHIITTLKNAISGNRVAHAYIFTGPRGIGKTSVARIFAKGLNCEKGPTTSPCNKCTSCNTITASTSMDVIEIDGASNNSVDQVRELRENIRFMPSYGRYKVYIIDEVHMLSIGAFNALLKTLEEPPKHAKFIFATTNPEKVPPTVLSRCQRFDFRRISLKLIISKLNKIVKTEKLDVSENAVFSIARASDGSIRDAESVLDQLASFCEKKIDEADVITLLGIIEEDKLAEVIEKLSKRDTAGLLKTVDELISAGKDISQFLSGLMGYLRNLMILKVSSGLTSLVDLPDTYIIRLKGQMKNFEIDELLYMFYTISATANAIKRSEVSRFIVEASLIKLSLRDKMMSLAEIMEKIAQLESNMSRYDSLPSEPRERRAPAYSPSPAEESEPITETEEEVSSEQKIRNTILRQGFPLRQGFGGQVGGQAKHEIPSSAKASPFAKASGERSEGRRDTNVEPIAVETKPSEPVEESGADVSLAMDDVKKTWPGVLQVIKSKKISVASYLLEGELMRVTGPVITLGFTKRFNFHKEALEHINNKKFVEKTASDVFGKTVKLEFITLEEAKVSSDEPEAASETEVEEELEYEAKKDAFEEPIIQSAIEIFNGKIVKGGEERPHK